MNKIGETLNQKTASHLWEIGNLLSTSCPAASRFYLFNLEQSLIHKTKLFKRDTQRSLLFCNHCGNLWAPGNHKVRVKPPADPIQHIKKLLKWARRQPWKLNSQQKRKLKKFNESTSHIVYSCFYCKKSTKFPGVTKFKRNRICNNPSSTHRPKYKCKKRDLNAGLFIPTSKKVSFIELEEKDLITSCLTPSSSNTTNSGIEPQLSKILPVNKIPDGSRQSNFSKHNFIHTPSTVMATKGLKESNASRNKKKNTLLAEIVKKEQAIKKKKNDLTSFLISL